MATHTALASNPTLPSLCCRCAALPRALGIPSQAWIIHKFTQSWFKDGEKGGEGWADSSCAVCPPSHSSLLSSSHPAIPDPSRLTGPQSPCETSAAHILSFSASRLPLRTEHSSSCTWEGHRQEQLQPGGAGCVPCPRTASGQLPPVSAPRHKCRFINPARAELPDCRREMAPWGLGSEGLMAAPEDFRPLFQLNDSMIPRYSQSQSLFTNWEGREAYWYSGMGSAGKPWEWW